MQKIIFDCDNTVGIEGYPMDDALAFLYLLGNRGRAQVLAFCCTFGNGTAQQVYESSRLLLEETGLSGEIPLYPGAGQGENPCGESARKIVELANRYPGEVSFLGIGSLTNLYGAMLLDSGIFDKLGQVVLMGGITETLYTHGKHCPELNFSINHKAAAAVLSRGKKISILTGNNCLPVSYLPKTEFMEHMQVESSRVGAYIAKKCGYRFDARKAVYGEEGSYCWDAVAAACLLYPQLFEDVPVRCSIEEEQLRTGFLNPSKQGDTVLNLPRAKDAAAFRQNLYESWSALQLTPFQNMETDR